jgi:16S rRNA processing protein RimM
MVFIGKKKEAYSLRSVRSMDQNFLIAFDSLTDCDQVSHMHNVEVFIQSTQLNRPSKANHYPHEVLGMQVVDEQGLVLGSLVEVLVTGANDVYIVKNAEEEETLLPAIETVILKVDEEKKVITVRPPIWE